MILYSNGKKVNELHTFSTFSNNPDTCKKILHAGITLLHFPTMALMCILQIIYLLA